MTNYIIQYVDKSQKQGTQAVLAENVRHALKQAEELLPEVRFLAALPESIWNNAKEHSDA